MLRRARLLSGLVLMVFVTSHLGNLLIGIHSLAALEAWRANDGPVEERRRTGAPAGLGLRARSAGLYATFARCSFAMNRTDVVQLALDR
jgi:adenylate cyclase